MRKRPPSRLTASVQAVRHLSTSIRRMTYATRTLSPEATAIQTNCAATPAANDEFSPIDDDSVKLGTAEQPTVPPTGKQVRELREGRRVTLAELSERTGIAQPSLHRKELGTSTLRPGEFERLAAAIETEAAYKATLEAQSESDQMDDADDAEPEGPPDWRAHLPAELAALMDGDMADAVADVGTKDAGKARRRLMALAKSQELVEQERRKKNVQARALRASRLIAARKLNGWDQEEAARRLGYSNSTQLSLLESGSREAKLDHVIKAADVYHVSADFLLGRLPSEVELDARTVASGRVLEGLQHVADTLMRYVDASDRTTGGPTVETVRNLAMHARAVSSAMARIDGPALDAIKGGSTLAFSVEQLEEVAMEAARGITGYEGEVQRLRDLLRSAPANDPSWAEPTGKKRGGSFSLTPAHSGSYRHTQL